MDEDQTNRTLHELSELLVRPASTDVLQLYCRAVDCGTRDRSEPS